MTGKTPALARISAHRIQQTIKWVVYTLLLINFGFYIVEDWNRAMHTLTEESGLLDWASEFATSIDESAWFILLLMFELETYVLDDDDWTGPTAHAIRGTRVVCFLMIAHTVYAFAVSAINLQPTVPVENVTSLCEMTDDNVSFVYNLEYTAVTPETCDSLSTASQFYWVSTDPVVSDLEGLELERELIRADLAEVIIWLLVILTIEVAVRLQDRGVTEGLLLSTTNALKVFFYLSLIGLGIYWANLSHWLYLWDELVWIGGFMAIEMNVREWRDEILEVRDNTSAFGPSDD